MSRVLLAVLFALPLGCLEKKSSGGADVAKTYTRDEFKKLVMGKTPDEVRVAIGKPDSTSENGGEVYWYYDRRTTDPETGKIDSHAQVVFGDGKVVRINF